MWDKSNCSVIYRLFKITLLGTWNERGERPEFPRSPHRFCAFCPVLSLLLLWTVLLGPHQTLNGFATCRLTEGMSNLWTKWRRLLLPIFLFTSCPFFIMVQVFKIPFPPVCDLCSFSQIFASCWLAGYIADVAETFESLIWLAGRAAWNSLSSSLLPIPHTCLPAAAVYPLWAFSVPQPSVVDISSYLCLLLPSFPWLLQKSHLISITLSFATLRIQLFLWLLPAGLSWYLSRDFLGLPHPVLPPMSKNHADIKISNKKH